MIVINLPVDRNFRDPIHGYIDVYEHETKIIDDPVFQRLRGIKQLSFGYYVYHGAEHSRFGHCLGVMHIASKALESIVSNTKKYVDKEFQISPNEYLTVRLAALLHDVGHKPFSHALGKTIGDKKHEDYSVGLVQNHFAEHIEHAGLKPSDVAALIKGNYDPTKTFLADLVRGQLDVDRLDYLLRDSHYAGVNYGLYDLQRLLATLCVKDNSLAVMDDGSDAALQFVFARYFMFEQVYLHRTKRAFEGMARLAAKYLDDKILHYPSVKDLNKSNIETFAYDDSWFLGKIRETDDHNYFKIAQQILKRQNYKEIYNSYQIRHKFLKLRKKGANQQMALGFLEAVETALNEDLKTLGINEWEHFFDTYSNLPYELRPYSPRLEHEEPLGDEEQEEEQRRIFIYDKDSRLLDAIENKYPILETFAKNAPRIKRFFVYKDRCDEVREFLRKKYPPYFN